MSLISEFIYIGRLQPNKFLCPNWNDFAPCTCEIEGKKFVVKCKQISPEKIHQTFKKTASADIDRIELLDPIGYFIPKDVVATNWAAKIILTGSENNPENYCPEIHPEAFRSSSNVTEEFAINWIDMSQMDFSFLVDFNELRILRIYNSINAHLSNLPSLLNLTELHVRYTAGINNWTHNFPARLPSGLVSIIMQDNTLNDEAVNRLLNWILNGPSRNTLRYLFLSGNTLTRIPRQLKSFSNLADISIDRQKEPGFGFLAFFSLPSSIRFLNLSSNYITGIQPGSFQGCK